MADEPFCRAIVGAIGEQRVLKCEAGTLRCIRTDAFDTLAGDAVASLPVRPSGAQSSNSVVFLGDRLVLKAYRRLFAGINPEFEIGKFLTETAHFKYCVPIAGAIEYVSDAGATMTVALLQGYVENQGDAWSYTLNYIEQYLDALRAGTVAPDAPTELHGGYLALVRTLAQRTAELHAALAMRTGDPAFDPEPIEARDVSAWTASVRTLAESALARLEQKRATLDAKTLPAAGRLLAARDALLKRIDTAAPPSPQGFKTRLHGDYHLGQVLLAQNDFVITDFEGEPARTLAERRQKHSALKDVAGMLRSFNYALYQAMANAAAARPDALPSLEGPTRAWEAATRKAFTETYRDTAARAGMYPVWDDARRLLDLFTVEKACYELAYELDNRPDWVRVPIAGLLDLMRVSAHD